MDTTTGRGRDWAQLAILLADQLAAGDGLMQSPLVSRPLVDGLVRGLLLAADHRHREAFAAPAPPMRPAAIRTAVELIETQPMEPWTTSSLARRCLVSVRSLQEGFQRHVGTAPMAYLRAVRLRRAHEDLRAADPSLTTVTAIALRWGFGNPGRFAAEHEAAYGEKPHRTLRRAR
jgi:transcriptional regulator GlxA family with amidase domain